MRIATNPSPLATAAHNGASALKSTQGSSTARTGHTSAAHKAKPKPQPQPKPSANESRLQSIIDWLMKLLGIYQNNGGSNAPAPGTTPPGTTGPGTTSPGTPAADGGSTSPAGGANPSPAPGGGLGQYQPLMDAASGMEAQLNGIMGQLANGSNLSQAQVEQLTLQAQQLSQKMQTIFDLISNLIKMQGQTQQNIVSNMH